MNLSVIMLMVALSAGSKSKADKKIVLKELTLEEIKAIEMLDVLENMEILSDREFEKKTEAISKSLEKGEDKKK